MYRAKTRRLKRYALFLCSLLLLACQPPFQHQQQQFLQFGTLIDVTLEGVAPDKAQQVFTQIETLLKQRHRQWHGWQEGELQRFNRALASGQQVVIPPILRELIERSKTYYQITGGRFNPALGKLVAAWGFHQNQSPDYANIERLRRNLPDMDDLIIDADRARSTNPDLQLDFGAIAKGLAIRQIATLIRQQGITDFLINAGGDIYAEKNLRDDKTGWRVAIENPFYDPDHASRIVGTVTLKAAESIFTSGDYRRFSIDKNGRKRHHIIDPKSGEPSRQVSSATVLTNDPVLADVAATTLMLTAPQDLAAVTRALGIRDFLIITSAHTAYLSSSLQPRIEWPPEPGLNIQIVQQITGRPARKLAE